MQLSFNFQSSVSVNKVVVVVGLAAHCNIIFCKRIVQSARLMGVLLPIFFGALFYPSAHNARRRVK